MFIEIFVVNQLAWVKNLKHKEIVLVGKSQMVMGKLIKNPKHNDKRNEVIVIREIKILCCKWVPKKA